MKRTGVLGGRRPMRLFPKITALPGVKHAREEHGFQSPPRKRPVETVVGNGQFRDAGGGTGMTGFGWFSDGPVLVNLFG